MSAECQKATSVRVQSMCAFTPTPEGGERAFNVRFESDISKLARLLIGAEQSSYPCNYARYDARGVWFVIRVFLALQQPGNLEQRGDTDRGQASLSPSLILRKPSSSAAISIRCRACNFSWNALSFGSVYRAKRLAMPLNQTTIRRASSHTLGLSSAWFLNPFFGP